MVLLQETHTSDESQLRKRGKIHGYRLIGATYHPHYGIATYARATLEGVKLISTLQDDDIFAVTVKVADTLLTNIYKPPAAIWPDNILPTGDHPSIYTGDSNSQHTQWRYSQNNQNGTKLMDWAEAHYIQLVFGAKHKSTFHSARWGTETTPDLCFVSSDQEGKPVPVNRHVLEAFPHSQHRPVLLKVDTQIPIIRGSYVLKTRLY